MRRGIIAGLAASLPPPQTTTTNGGRSYFIKRGGAAVNPDFFSGASAVAARVRITDWVTESGDGFCNLLLANFSAGDNAANYAGGCQFYYQVSTGNIGIWFGEAWPDTLTDVRSGQYSGWMTLVMHCAGTTSDQVKLSIVFDDEDVVHTYNVGLGGNLRQVAFGGAFISVDERSTNLHLGPLIVYKRDLSDAEILSLRMQYWPQFQGTSNLFFYNDFKDGVGCQIDQSASWGGTGGHDFQAYDEGQQSQVSDYPMLWDPMIAPTALSNLRSFWTGNDVTPASGVANNWPANAGSQMVTLANLSSAATVATRYGKRGITGRMQANTPVFVDGAVSWTYHYVLQVPTLDALRGMSAYSGKPLPVMFGYTANAMHTSRGNGGTSFEAPVQLVADVSSWVGKLLSIAIRHTPTSAAAYWRIDRVAGEVEINLASTNFGPTGFVLGGFADSGGLFNSPVFSGTVAPDVSPQECRNLATWGANNWS